MTYPDLAGRVAVVTGGSRGIGAATCHALAANGVRVAVSGRDGTAIDAVVAGIRADGGTAVGIRADVTSLDEVRRLRAEVEREYGPADILAAFAGGTPVPPGPVVDLDEADFVSTVDSNLVSTFRCLKVFLPPMLDAGHGAVVTMASAGARQAAGAPVAYAAAKAGVLALTRQVARDVAANGVRVNAVAPASIGTESTLAAMTPEIQRRVAALHPVGRIGEPVDVANATLFLTSDSASFITGVTLDVAGGTVLR